MRQRTIAKNIEIQGKGLHTGKGSSLLLKPSPENSGVVFLRTDQPGSVPIPARIDWLDKAERCTAIGKFPNVVMTVEHLMAALYGIGISNVCVEIKGDEVPALDGSAAPFVKFLEDAGIIEQDEPEAELFVDKPVWCGRKDSLIFAVPARELRITYVAKFNHPLVGTQMLELAITPESFKKEIAPSRTFGFWEEVQGLWNRNLALGGDLENAILIMENSYSTPLRFEDEVVRHKMLDMVGDIALLGSPLRAHIIAVKGSHSLNMEFLKILQSKEGADAEHPGDFKNSSSPVSFYSGGQNS
ncbi:MAG: UDP-3-O-acyl-N-acetylglucosamine deacetylase [Firmicutes bacterium]|nr:UDP-3-O-acyl-N-acetylglucosamine deacetylase [Bacillota bacterium]